MANTADLRAEVAYALTRQPGEDGPAIDGDGHGIVSVDWLKKRVPPQWHEAIAGLEQDFADMGVELFGDKTKGISTLRFHDWVALRVCRADESFDPGAHYIGRGRNAQAIQQSLHEWAIA